MEEQTQAIMRRETCLTLWIIKEAASPVVSLEFVEREAMWVYVPGKIMNPARRIHVYGFSLVRVFG